MNAETRKRIKLNRHLRAAPGRKRAYRVAKSRGDMDGVLRALYPERAFVIVDMERGFLSMRRLDGGRSPR